MSTTMRQLFVVAGEAQITAATSDFWEAGEDSLPFHDGRGIHARRAIRSVRRHCRVIEERRPGAQQTTVPACCRAADAARVHTHNRDTSLQELVNAGESAAAESHYTGIGVDFAVELRIRRGVISVPDGLGDAQKYVAKEASSRAKSLRLLNGS